MPLQKPRNWYEMDYAAQQEWTRNARRMEDMEYEQEQAQRKADQALREVRSARAATDSLRGEVSDLSDTIDNLREVVFETRRERNRLRQFVTDHGLLERFTEWNKAFPPPTVSDDPQDLED